MWTSPLSPNRPEREVTRRSIKQNVPKWCRDVAKTWVSRCLALYRRVSEMNHCSSWVWRTTLPQENNPPQELSPSVPTFFKEMTVLFLCTFIYRNGGRRHQIVLPMSILSRRRSIFSPKHSTIPSKPSLLDSTRTRPSSPRRRKASGLSQLHQWRNIFSQRIWVVHQLPPPWSCPRHTCRQTSPHWNVSWPLVAEFPGRMCFPPEQAIYCSRVRRCPPPSGRLDCTWSKIGQKVDPGGGLQAGLS